MEEAEKLIIASRQVGSKSDHAFHELMSRMIHETARSDGEGNTEADEVLPDRGETMKKLKRRRKMKKTKEVKKLTKVKKTKKAESPVCSFGKEVEAFTLAHKKLFLAIANDCKSRTQTMASMYAIHASLTNLEFEECNRLFLSGKSEQS